jgi:hypothetical protein
MPAAQSAANCAAERVSPGCCITCTPPETMIGFCPAAMAARPITAKMHNKIILSAFIFSLIV